MRSDPKNDQLVLRADVLHTPRAWGNVSNSAVFDSLYGDASSARPRWNDTERPDRLCLCDWYYGYRFQMPTVELLQDLGPHWWLYILGRF